MNNLSKYVHMYRIENYNLLYHALTTKVFLISNSQAEMLKNNEISIAFSENEIELLKKKGLIINREEGINEINIEQIIKENNQENPDLFTLYLLLSERCNMNCVYCSHTYREKDKQGDMSIETAINALEKFYEVDTKRKRSIVLYGGEPLMNKKAVMATIDYVREKRKDKSSEIVIITNATLLDEPLIKYFSDNDITIIISVDGEREIHDRFRKIGERGTFDYIEKVTSIFNNKGIRFGLSATIAAHNIKELDRVTEYFYQNFNPISIGLNPLHKKKLGDVKEYEEELESFVSEYSVEEDDVAKAMISAYKVAQGNGLYVEQIMRRIRPFILSRPRLKDCPACGAMIRVLADGSFGPCGQVTEERKNVNIENCSFVKNGLLTNWNRRLSCSLSTCNNCEAMALCGGGCPANSIKNGNDLFKIGEGERTCSQSKIILEWLLSELIAYFPEDKFIEIEESDKLKLLGKIDVNKKTPFYEYSRYGEFILDPIYK